MRVLITGASGLIGRNWIRHALREGHEVRALVRNPENFRMLPRHCVFQWDHRKIPSSEALSGVDAIVHLAGENIADKSWSKEQKKRIVESRLLGTQNLVRGISSVPIEVRPKVLVASSGVGFYGYQRENTLDEGSSAGTDFLAQLCKDWEGEALKAQSLGLRVVLARTGIVLSREGGALTKIPPVQIGVGRNWMSWIHIEDMVRALQFAIETPELRGPVNFVSSNPVVSKDFVQTLAKTLRVPVLGFVPQFVLKLALGEVAQVVLSSLRVHPKALLDSGFIFQFPTLKPALECELKDQKLFDSILVQDQFVPLPPKRVFPFFSRAENLEILTPPWLNFKIVSKTSDQIVKGSLINYRLKIHGVPVRWRTLISDWKENEGFVDLQLKGPYSKWHHVHKFEPVAGGCLLRDEVTYRVPGFILGKLLLSKWITSDVASIFNFRQKRIQEIVESGELS